MLRLNPFAAVTKRAAVLQQMRKEGRDKRFKERRSKAAAPKKAGGEPAKKPPQVKK